MISNEEAEWMNANQWTKPARDRYLETRMKQPFYDDFKKYYLDAIPASVDVPKIRSIKPTTYPDSYPSETYIYPPIARHKHPTLNKYLRKEDNFVFTDLLDLDDRVREVERQMEEMVGDHGVIARLELEGDDYLYPPLPPKPKPKPLIRLSDIQAVYPAVPSHWPGETAVYPITGPPPGPEHTIYGRPQERSQYSIWEAIVSLF